MACHKPGRAVGARRATKRLTAVLVGLAAAVGGLGAPLAPAFAGQLQTARARAAALLVQADSEARLVHSLTLRYEQNAAQAGFWHEQVGRAEDAATSLELRSAMTKALLQQEAVLSYADSVPSQSPAAGQSAGNFVAAADRQAYMTAAVGDLSATLAQFNTERSSLVATIAAARKDMRAGLASGERAAAARREALREAVALQAMLARARSEIAVLSARQRRATGPPVGNGVVRALATQLGVPSAGPAAVTATEPVTTTKPVTTTTRATTTSTTVVTTTVATVATTTTTTTVAPAPTTTTTTDPPAPSAVATTVPPASSSPAEGVWLELRECESGDNYQADTGNGYYGAYQFSASTWSDLGYPGRPDLEPYWMQDAAAQRLETAQGWAQWPSCSAALGF